MELKELHDFVKSEDHRLRDLYPDQTLKERILSRMCKLTEEVGELSEQVLKSLAMQRKEKMVDVKKEDLEDELVDVLITTFLLSEILEVNIETAIENKVEKIKKRNY
ncbi:MAG: MazG nucleotide pyrophosphohydrolase domain-containing protein [Patescibacteria group bacterium]